ncbi:hypothetical protein ACIHAR_02755 [Streptomyces sp. NPDC052016]|uniref:hypothetical protein n=1 Tax=Streptomyces sp. NPDC052016 TaxID=3365680 RepID=UPI0037D97883
MALRTHAGKHNHPRACRVLSNVWAAGRTAQPRSLLKSDSHCTGRAQQAGQTAKQEASATAVQAKEAAGEVVGTATPGHRAEDITLLAGTDAGVVPSSAACDGAPTDRWTTRWPRHPGVLKAKAARGHVGR